MLQGKSLKQKFYGGDYQSPFARFNEEARKLTSFNTVVFHAGCGADETIGFRSLAGLTIGMDANSWIKTNRDLDGALIGDLSNIPLCNESTDLIAARYVMEHLEYPELYLKEVSRVLRPGGFLVILTPNLWNYATFITKLSPYGFQKWFIENILNGKPEEVFSVFYRANTPHRISKLALQAGLEVERIHLIEGAPNLLAFSSATFLLGVVYERLVMRFDLLANLRCAILAVFRKR
jgi:SAM-dependent methyltransferase